MATPRTLRPQLVHSPGLWPQFEQAATRNGLNHLIVQHRFAGFGFVGGRANRAAFGRHFPHPISPFAARFRRLPLN
jgi:hypothetical protein